MNSPLIHTSFNLAHQIAGAAVRGAIYHTQSKLFAHLSMGQTIGLAAVIIALVWLWSRRR